uniref:Natural killer cell cytotoxicity receptor 3 ligand 1 n=1 Tax=Pelodiscus sinensis TaxID=13735 RepID=K7G649_PELSI|nr:natural cytotoxicity triggering receptor 3 ligand 1 [Pelodiscus sinensis]|eukprot:XP_006134659.1 natural cytotoxicity triggering receptor 3 ligand 1 [Pelodiscus sinensis]
MKSEPLIVSLNDNIFVSCNISGYDTPELDIKKVGVTWYYKTDNADTETKIFIFHTGEHIPFRKGASMSDSYLKRGNAALSLPQIQFKDAGIYKCSVIVTPSEAHGTSILQVVAQPTVNVFPKEVTIESEKERTLSCEVNKFYPNSVDIKWKKISRNNQDHHVAAEDICTGASVENKDGTFNVTSKLRLQPSLQDNGNIYSCIVSHVTLPAKLLLNITLTVTAPKSDLNSIIGAVIGTIIACIIVLGVSTYVYNKRFKKIPPTVIAFIGNVEMKHLEDAFLHCQISSFRPKPLTVDFFLKKYQQKQKERIYHWNSEKGDIEQNGENAALLTMSKTFQFKICLRSLDNGTFEVPCTIRITPDLHELDKAELSLEVTHEALQPRPAVQTTQLKVIAMPVLDPVLCSTDVPRPDESITLTCRIHSFFPKTIELVWYKDNDQVPEEPFISKVETGTDGLFFCTSSLKLHLTVGDIGKRFICKAKLKGSHQYKESFWKLENLIFTPNVSNIVCEPCTPENGKAVMLSCQVRDYYPEQCQVRWLRGFEELIKAAVKTQDPQLDAATNLYHQESQVTFTAEPADHTTEFFIEVSHCDKTIRRSHPLMLKDFPRVTDLVLSPHDAEYGKPLSLTCKIMDFYPSDIQVHWFQENSEIKKGSSVQEPKQDSGGRFYTSSDLQLIPTALDYGKKIGLRVIHKTLTKPITKNVYLKLPAKSPVVSEIRATPTSPKVNETVCLEVSISDFAPENIKVAWYKEWLKLPTDNNYKTDTSIGKNGLCFCTIKVQFTIDASDDGKMFRCEIIHPSTNSCTEKMFILKLGGSSTSTGDIATLTANQNHTLSPGLISQEINTLKIECTTSNPKAGEDVTLRCFIPGRTADSTCVSWFKGKYLIEDGIENTDCEDESGFNSSVTFKPEEQDKECKMRCEVFNDEDSLEDSYILKLA